MTVKAEKAIRFFCENCGTETLMIDTLEPGAYCNEKFREDRINCGHCGTVNHVVMAEFDEP